MVPLRKAPPSVFGPSASDCWQYGELELQVDALQSAVHGLSNPADGLSPTEGFLEPFADDLADAVTRMAGRATIDRAAPAPSVVGSDMGRDVALATGGDEIGGVVGFVGADAAAPACGRHRVEHGQGGLAFAEAIGIGDHGTDDSLPAHNKVIVRDYVASTNGMLTLHFLPGYAPDLNPDELVRSHAKRTGTARRPLLAGEKLRDKIEDQLAKLQRMPGLVRLFFRHPSAAYIADC